VWSTGWGKGPSSTECTRTNVIFCITAAWNMFPWSYDQLHQTERQKRRSPSIFGWPGPKLLDPGAEILVPVPHSWSSDASNDKVKPRVQSTPARWEWVVTVIRSCAPRRRHKNSDVTKTASLTGITSNAKSFWRWRQFCILATLEKGVKRQILLVSKAKRQTEEQLLAFY